MKTCHIECSGKVKQENNYFICLKCKKRVNKRETYRTP